MPAVKTGMTPPPMPGMPAPMQPMGGVPPMQNPFAPMPPMPLAGAPMPQPQPPMPPMAQGQMPQGQQQQVMGSTAGRRRRFGDALEGILGGNQGIGAAMPQQQRPLPMPQMMPQQRMVAPNTPMMRTPTPRPMAMGGEVDIFGYEDGGPVVQGYKPGGVVIQKNTDGTVSILHSSGGIQTTSGPNALEAMQAAYPGATVVDSGTTSGALASAQQAVRDARRAEVIAQTAAGQTYGDADLGYDPVNVDAYIRSDAGQGAFNPFGDEDPAQFSDWYDRAINMGERALDRYLSPEEVAGMTDKQKLAAGELFTQGGGAKEYNYLSAEDIDFIQNKANEWGGAVADPLRQAISFGAGSGEYKKADDSGASSTSSVSSSASSGGGSYTNPAVTYEASPVDSGEVNPIDYSQFRGDVGQFAGTPESSALFGPRINIPTSVSQYYGDPMSGGLSTTYGPEMVATSPIGAIKLPARPVDLDIFDYLSEPTYGSLLDRPVYQFMDGGSVPRQTMIGDQPHMLAYINPQEANLLSDLGGTGEPGPGGIPAYRNLDADLGVGATNTGKTYSGSDKAVSGGFDAAAATADDDKPSKRAGQSSNMTSVPTGTVDFTLPPTSSDDKPPVVATIDFGDDDDGPVIKDVTYYDDTGTTEIDAPVVTTNTAYVDPNTGGVTIYDEPSAPASVYTPPPVYTDRRGNQYSSQAEADAADRAFAAQLASYGSGKVGFDRFKSDAAETFPGRPREETDRMAARAYPDFVEDYSRDVNIFDPAPFTYTGIGGIGAGPESGSLGVTPAPVVDPDAQTGKEAFNLINNLTNFYDNKFDQDGQPVISLGEMGLRQPAGTPTSMFEPDRDSYDPRGNQIVSPTGTGIGRESDLQRGLGSADRQTYYGGSGPRDERDMYQAPAESVIAKTIAGFEGRTETPYWDVNANRAGYGSDTKTDPETGEVTKITPDTKVSKAEADADLNRRLTTEFIPRLVNTVGADTFYSMNPEQQAALTSITYNYGKLPDRVASVVNNVDPSTAEGQKAISDAIRSLEGDNDGVNRNRRNSEADLFLGQGDVPETSVVEKPDTGVTPEQREKNAEKIKKQIGDQAEPTGVEKFFYDVVGQLGLGLGKPLADKLRGASREERQAIIDQHLYALQNGATPKTDEEGNYVGFDISTMDTFADKVLGAEDITQFLPGGAEDADGDGVPDYVRFGQVYDAQSTAAAEDPYGYSTEQGFITSDGKEFFVDASGNVVEITDGTVPFEPGGGEDVAAALGVTETITGGEDSGTTMTDDTGHVDGVCNTEGYVYNPETDMCEPPSEEEKSDTVSSPISTTGRSMRSFEDILAGITTPAPKIAPISANIRPMQGGGMVGLNRAADNFIKALAG